MTPLTPLKPLSNSCQILKHCQANTKANEPFVTCVTLQRKSTRDTGDCNKTATNVVYHFVSGGRRAGFLGSPSHVEALLQIHAPLVSMLSSDMRLRNKH